MKKIEISLPEEIVEIIDKKVVNKLGKDRSEALKTIVMNWLSEQGYLGKGGTKKEHLPIEKHPHSTETFYTS